MANNIDTRLQRIAAEGRTGLMTHVVVGYPSLAATADIVVAMEETGADFVELQIPFSDPLADGPTIQRACEAALARGTKVKDAFAVAAILSTRVQIPLLFMAYFNTVYTYGVDRFCADAAIAGISGLIIPDAPLEAAEHEGLLAACKKNGLHNIITLAPTSTEVRLKKNAAIAQGFAYCMSRQGVTGAGQAIDPGVQAYLERVRKHIGVPLAVGFGISDQERLRLIAPHCEVAVVGSAIIDVIASAKPQDIIPAVKRFMTSLQS